MSKRLAELKKKATSNHINFSIIALNLALWNIEHDQFEEDCLCLNG